MNRLRAWWPNLKRRFLYRRCLRAPSRAIILRYHSVGPIESVSRYVDPGLSVDPQRFHEHIRILRERFAVLPIEELLARVRRGEQGMRAVAITFDDGYRDNHDVALPILEAENVVATFYVTSRPTEAGRWFWISELRRIVDRLPEGTIAIDPLPRIEVPVDVEKRVPVRRALTRELSAFDEGRRESVLDGLASSAGVPRGEGLADTFLTPELIRSMAQRGMTIGAHTRSHPHLDRLASTELVEEIEGGRDDLARVLGSPVIHFAYPNPGGGQSNPESVRTAVRSAGFDSAVTSKPNPLRKNGDVLAIPRLGVYAGEQERTLFSVLSR